MKNNAIVILCDQLRPDFLSCYNANSPVQTPHIDALVRDGVLFEHAITASPVCAPGRACMMTGRYVSDHQVWTNDVPFREGIDYLPARMKANGYACGAFGKLHHFPQRDNKGFDVAWQMEENRMGEEDDYFQYLHALHPEVNDVFNIDGNHHFPYSPEEYYESQIAARALAFIDEHKNSDNGFFTWISFQGPHTPMDSPKQPYDVQEVPAPEQPEFDPPCEVPLYRKWRKKNMSVADLAQYRLTYAEMITFIDGKIGEIIAYLKRENLYDTTTIVFSTDHGDLCGDYGMTQKGPFLYAAQLEVPFIVANHPALPKNMHSDMLTSNLDIASTILEAIGDSTPLAYSRAIGAMFNTPALQHKSIYSEFCDSVKILSDKTFRFAYYPFAGEYELVKIGNETTDLSKEPAYQPQIIHYLKDIIDYMTLAKGVRIEAQDLTPRVQQGLQEKHPQYMDEIPLVFPLATMEEYELLRAHGLDAEYNAFCKEREILRFYSKYWDETIKIM